MPELPELQAHAERLTEAFAGITLERFRPISFTALKTFDPPADASVGEALRGVGRRGKYLLLDFGELTHVVHLMLGGRLRPDEKQSARPRGGQVRWIFDDGRALLLSEAGKEHRAGVWAVHTSSIEDQEPVLGLGPDADSVSVEELAELLAEHHGACMACCRDQRVVAGIGRRLANEVCHRAKLSPFANASKLDDGEITQLHEALTACVADSLADERTRDEMVASKDRLSMVHKRDGQACPACDDTVHTVEYRRYTVYYCPTCQTRGKALADNTTSKFVK